MNLTDARRALVTGASRGLGVEIAAALAREGLDLILAARSADALAQVAADLRQASGRAVDIFDVDLADAGQLGTLAERVEATGGVDILVNNAGVESTLRYHERTADDIDRTIAINLTAPMQLTRALLPGMLARGRGHIVNIASIGGVLAIPFNEPYSATKFGLVGFTRALRLTAQASGWPVSASVVCPGFIDSAGLFEDMRRRYDIPVEGVAVRPLEEVGRAVVMAIQRDLPDVYTAEDEFREVIALSVREPAAYEAAALGDLSTAIFRTVADARSPQDHPPGHATP